MPINHHALLIPIYDITPDDGFVSGTPDINRLVAEVSAYPCWTVENWLFRPRRQPCLIATIPQKQRQAGCGLPAHRFAPLRRSLSDQRGIRTSGQKAACLCPLFSRAPRDLSASPRARSRPQLVITVLGVVIRVIVFDVVISVVVSGVVIGVVIGVVVKHRRPVGMDLSHTNAVGQVYIGH